MSAGNTTPVHRAILERAHAASQSGFDVFVHVEGFSPLQVREVESLDESTTFATIRCWPNTEGKSEVWLIPLGAVRGVQIHDDCVPTEG